MWNQCPYHLPNGCFFKFYPIRKYSKYSLHVIFGCECNDTRSSSLCELWNINTLQSLVRIFYANLLMPKMVNENSRQQGTRVINWTAASAIVSISNLLLHSMVPCAFLFFVSFFCYFFSYLTGSSRRFTILATHMSCLVNISHQGQPCQSF